MLAHSNAPVPVVSFELWIRALEKLSIAVLVKIFPALYEIHDFPAVFTRAHNWTLHLHRHPGHILTSRFLKINFNYHVAAIYTYVSLSALLNSGSQNTL
jgi:hypothetical protein